MTLAYWSRDPKQIIPDLTEVKPSLLPVGAADLREDLHAGHERRARPREARPGGGAGREGAHGAGRRARRCRPSSRPRSTQADEALYKNVRALFGGRIRECVTGAAPIAPEILRFFYACGVPVMEGYGMTETSTSATVNRPAGDGFRFGSVGQPAGRRGGEDRRGRRGADQGPEHLPGLLQERGGHGARRSRTAGCTPATSAASTRTASSTSPAARRTSSSPRAARTSRRPTWRTGSSRAAGSRRRWWWATAARTWSR